ncbi:hypothetical protein [Chitinophaga sp. RAB17]|uniref:hypothetical protein n=1 Tax=Chitinophaga sp. RAB17 TaxID=3233049 RepID=UPI003F8F7589
MRYKQAQIFIQSFLAALLVFGIFISLSCNEKQHNAFPFRGKIIAKAIINGKAWPDLEQIFYLQGPYLIERNYNITWSGLDSTSGKVISYAPDDARYKTLTGYSVTDMSKKIVLQYDTASAKPSILARFPLSEKKDGYLFLTELKELQNNLEDFVYTGDTTIEHIHLKILTDSIPSIQENGVTIEKMVAYLNPNIKNFPVKVSSFLDKKFDGWVSCISIDGKKDSVTSNTTFEVSYQSEINKEEQRLLDKFIKLTKENISKINH